MEKPCAQTRKYISMGHGNDTKESRRRHYKLENTTYTSAVLKCRRYRVRRRLRQQWGRVVFSWLLP